MQFLGVGGNTTGNDDDVMTSVTKKLSKISTCRTRNGSTLKSGIGYIRGGFTAEKFSRLRLGGKPEKTRPMLNLVLWKKIE